MSGNTKTNGADESNVTIEGEGDAGWTSYWDSDTHGQTVAGTTDDDLGDVVTEFLPDEIDLTDATDLQAEILKAFFANPIASQAKIAEVADCTGPSVKNTLDKFKIEPNWAERARERGDEGIARRLAADTEPETETEDEDDTDETVGECETEETVGALPPEDFDFQSDSRSELQTTIDAIRATATTDETRAAMDYLANVVGDGQ